MTFCRLIICQFLAHLTHSSPLFAYPKNYQHHLFHYSHLPVLMFRLQAECLTVDVIDASIVSSRVCVDDYSSGTVSDLC